MTEQVRVIALEWNVPMLIDVLVELSKRHNWRPLYCVSYGLHDQVKRHFPEAVYQDTFDARFGRPPAALADLQWSGLDQPTAEALGYASLLALKQMDRMEIMGGFAVHDRFIHLHRLASYWSAVLDRLQPDVLLMPTAPHVVYDYIAYILAKRRGIRAVMFEYVTTEGLLIAIDRFDDGLPPLTAAYRKLLANPPALPVVLSDRMESYLRRLAGNYEDAIPSWTLHVRKTAEAMRAIQARARAEAKAAADFEAAQLAAIGRRNPVARGPLGVLFQVFGLQRIAPAEEAFPRTASAIPFDVATDGHYAGRFYTAAEVPVELARRAAEHRFQHQEHLGEYYDKLAIAADLSEAYVYVPLHLQPERSTNPIGGVFDDQHVMVGMIAAALPDDWRIYVKEHPSQLAPQFASERGRWTSFYDALVEIPRVTLVERDTPSFDLIDNARAVATITGTSSWEAIVRQVSTLVFGEPWYKGCPGSYTIRTLEDCRTALARIAAGDRPDSNTTRLFAKAAEDASFVGFLGLDEQPIAGTDMDTNVKRLTMAIVECYTAGCEQQVDPSRYASAVRLGE